MTIPTLPTTPYIHLNGHETLFQGRPPVRPHNKHQYIDKIMWGVSSLTTIKWGSSKSKPGKFTNVWELINSLDELNKQYVREQIAEILENTLGRNMKEAERTGETQ